MQRSSTWLRVGPSQSSSKGSDGLEDVAAPRVLARLFGVEVTEDLIENGITRRWSERGLSTVTRFRTGRGELMHVYVERDCELVERLKRGILGALFQPSHAWPI